MPQRGGQRAVDGRTRLVIGALAAVELALTIPAAFQVLPLAVFLAIHPCVVAIAAGALFRAEAGDRTFHALGILVILLAGPLGAIGFLAMILAIDRVPPSADLDVWYQRLSGSKKVDLATNLHEAIINGRALQPATDIPVFTRVLIEGNLEQKQALLGLIGRKYHRNYYPVLKLALRSPQAVVRAQAAAVFAKLKEEHKARLNRNLAEGGDGADAPGQIINRAREILTCAQSGFIDPPEAGRARAAAKVLCEEALGSDPHSVEWQLLLCGVLTAEGEHDAVIKLLQQSVDAAPAELRSLYAQSLMRLRRHRELGQLYQHRLVAAGLNQPERTPAREGGERN